MTININQFTSGAPVGPGLPMSLSSDTSSFPSPATWEITFALAANGVSPFAVFRVPNAFNFQQVFPWTKQSGMTQTSVSIQNYEDGQSIHLQVKLLNSSGTQIDINDTTQTQTYQSQLGLAQQALDLAGTSGGLTTDQAAQLASAATDSATAAAGIQTTITQGGSTIATTIGQLFGGFGLDSLAVVDLSGGVTCDPINVTLAGAPFGVIVEATTVPDFYPFTAPGDQWTPLDLAVIQFVRGTDVLKRIGMHTRKHMEYPLPGVILPLGTLIELPLLPPDYHLEVWWGNGVCGQAFGMQAP